MTAAAENVDAAIAWKDSIRAEGTLLGKFIDRVANEANERCARSSGKWCGTLNGMVFISISSHGREEFFISRRFIALCWRN